MGQPSATDSDQAAMEPRGQSGQVRVENSAPVEPQAGSSSDRFGWLRRGVEVLGTTCLVVGVPVVLTWWLRSAGIVTSLPLNILVGVAASLAASELGRRVWELMPSSEDLLFNEVLLWGYIRRRRTQRRLTSAKALLGAIAAGGAGATAELDRVTLLEGLVECIETRDRYLHGHSRRVARYSWMIAQQLGLDDETVAHVRTAAAIHDVGKIHTPRAVLHKPGRLTDEEFEIIKRHSPDGAAMVAALCDEQITAMVRHHHERLDGTGYPDRLAGEEIPLGARIISVADTFDAITSSRPYRKASAHKKALDILRGEAGTRLDADAVHAFCSHYAGQRGVAAWATLSEIPVRLLSLIGGSPSSLAASLPGLAAAAAATVGVASATASPSPPRGLDRSPQSVVTASTYSTSSRTQLIGPSVGPTRRDASYSVSGQASSPLVTPAVAAPVAPATAEAPAGVSGPLIAPTIGDGRASEEKSSKPLLPETSGPVESPSPAPAGETPIEVPAKEEKPKAEAPKEEPAPEEPKVEAPKEEPAPEKPKAEAPKEEPAPEKPKVEAPKEEPAPEEPKVEAPKEEPAPEEPKVEAPKEEPAPEEPKAEAPKEEEKPKNIIEEILEIII
ncbi:MAG TPA: HD-GYP domain-containing protein [Solirubrobacteraceae bacterium]|nr:HD-GYP domain-containing protein [Solirubrobacteraceae bacterium]